MKQRLLTQSAFAVCHTFILFVLVASAGCGKPAPSLDTSRWIRFAPEGGNFSILLPSEPVKQEQRTNSEFEATTYQIRPALSNLAGMAVGYADRPANHNVYTEPDKVLNAMRDQTVVDLSGQLLDEKKIQLGNYPGRELRVAVGGGFTVRQRLYLANQRVYSLMVIAGSKGLVSPEAEEFFKSFQIGR